LAYGYTEKYKQITLPFLVGIGVILIYYFSCAFILGGEEFEFLVSKIIIGIAFLSFFLYFIRNVWQNVAYINSVIAS